MQILCHCIAKGRVPNPEAFERLCFVAYRTIFPVIVGVAILSNTLNAGVLAFLHRNSAPNPARLYLLWLAVSHCLACVPVLVALLKKGRSGLSYAWAFYFAHLEAPFYNGLNFVCVYVIVGLSLDRFSAVCVASKYSAIRGIHRAYLTAVLAYAAAGVLYAPLAFHQRPQSHVNASDEWEFGEGRLTREPAWVAWALVVQVAHRLLPGVVLVLVNARILLTVVRSVRLRRGGSGKGHALRYKKDRQLLHLLLALTFVFLLTNVPSAVLQMTYIVKHEHHCDLNLPEEVARAVSNCLEMSSYCFDFVFYFLMNTEYRRGLVQIVNTFCKCLPGYGIRRTIPEASESKSGTLK